MTEKNEKIDELITKLKALGQKVKNSRDDFGQPLADRVGTRLDRLLTRLPQHNGDSKPQQPPQEPTLVCPKCGVLALQGAHFCSSCGFDFSAEARRQLKEGFEREKLERGARVGVVF